MSKKKSKSSKTKKASIIKKTTGQKKKLSRKKVVKKKGVKKNLKDTIGNSLKTEVIKIQTSCNSIKKEIGCFQNVFKENLGWKKVLYK